VQVPDACHYAPPRLEWVDTAEGTLYFTPPRWYRTDLDAKERARGAGSCKAVACAPPSAPPAEDAGRAEQRERLGIRSRTPALGL